MSARKDVNHPTNIGSQLGRRREVLKRQVYRQSPSGSMDLCCHDRGIEHVEYDRLFMLFTRPGYRSEGDQRRDFRSRLFAFSASRSRLCLALASRYSSSFCSRHAFPSFRSNFSFSSSFAFAVTWSFTADDILRLNFLGGSW